MAFTVHVGQCSMLPVELARLSLRIFGSSFVVKQRSSVSVEFLLYLIHGISVHAFILQASEGVNSKR